MNSLKLIMGENSILSMDGDCRGAVISCGDGVINITQQDDNEDHLLTGEQHFRINRKGRVIAWALSNATIEIVLRGINRYSVIGRLIRLIGVCQLVTVKRKITLAPKKIA